MKDKARGTNMTLRITQFTLLMMFGILGSVSLVLGERPSDKKSEADIITRAKVMKVFTSKETAYDYHLVELEVLEGATNRGVKPDQTLYVHCFVKNKGYNKREPGIGGHSKAPQNGDIITAWVLKDKKGKLHGIYPDWFRAEKSAAR